MSSEYEEYSDFSNDSSQGPVEHDTRNDIEKDNEKELIKNIEKVIKANRVKNHEKQRLSVNYSAQLLE